MVKQEKRLDLRPFRRRITLLRAWEQAGLGGCVGVALSICTIVGDRLDLWDAKLSVLPAIVIAAALIGALSGLLTGYSDDQIARSIDRRSELDDRLTTVYEIEPPAEPDDESFIEAITSDTLPRLARVSPASLYPIRVRPIHWIFTGLAAICVILYIAFETTLLLPPSLRADAAALHRQAQQVQIVSKPFLKAADQPGATAEDKRLAKGIRRFVRDLQKNRLSKQEALIRANQLAAQAKLLEQKRSSALGDAVSKAETAGEQLSQMNQNASLQKTDAAKLADKEAALDRKAASLQQQISSLQNMLNSAGKNGMSKAETAKMESQLADLKKQLQEVELSKRAAEMLAKLMALPDYKAAQKLLEEKAEEEEAMELLQKLNNQDTGQPQDNQQQTQLTADQLKQIADRLDALAQQLNTDAKLRAYAKALLEAAKQARMGNQKGLSIALAGAFGMQGQSGSSEDYGQNGKSRGMPAPWRGYYGTLNRSNKSSMLNLKIPEHMITSEIGHNGPSSYEEELGPAHLDAKSGIPYQAMLPKYEKTEESALSKGDIPPEMRTKVRDYFDSLHQGQ
jgi:hypothetical protein